MKKPTISSKILKPMTAEEVEIAANADPDARPLSDANLLGMTRTPQAKIIRRALALTQEEFALRYHIPIGTLRDWEQGRAEPDQPTRAFLTLIARDPDRVNGLLNSKHK
jgi:putative transcriptional regulator